MKTMIKGATGVEKGAKCSVFKWQLVALFMPVVIAALMLMIVSFIREEVKANYQANHSFRAEDLIWKLTMPALDAALK